MPPLRSRSTRQLSVAAIAAACAVSLGACGVEGAPAEEAGAPGDPAPARAALVAYLDGDRCDLLSDRLALTLASTAEAGRQRCEAGRGPADMGVKPGEYEIQDVEVIDGDGLARVRLDDGGVRDYRLVPGGPLGYRVDQVDGTFEASFGESLRLQARASADGPLVDARIRVAKPSRVSVDELGRGDFASSLERYYRVRVSIRSKSDVPVEIGSQAFTALSSDGFPLGSPREELGPDARPLPTTVEPGEVSIGELLFAVPRADGIALDGIRLQYGAGAGAATLTWTGD